MLHSTMIQQHVSNVTRTLFGIIWYNKNNSTFDILSSTYDTIWRIKCYMYQIIQCIKCTYLFPGFYARLRRVTFVEIISWQGECRTFSKVLPQTCYIHYSENLKRLLYIWYNLMWQMIQTHVTETVEKLAHWRFP